MYKKDKKMGRAVIEGNLHFVFLTSRCQEVFLEETKEVAEDVLRQKLEESGLDTLHVECLGFIMLISVRMSEDKSPSAIAYIVRKAGKDVLTEIKKVQSNGMQHLLSERYYVSTELPTNTRILQFIEEETGR